MASQQTVLEAWQKRQKAGTNQDALSTSEDGKRLFSYALTIGYIDTNGERVVLQWSPPRHCGSSVTVSHITLAAKFATKRIEAPKGHGRGCSTWCSHLKEMEDSGF